MEEDDDGIEVNSDTTTIDEVRLEEYEGSGTAVELHVSEEDENQTAEGNVQNTPTKTGNLSSLPTDKGIEIVGGFVEALRASSSGERT